MSCQIITVRPPYSTAITRSHIYELDGLAKSALFQHAEPVSQQDSNRATEILGRLQVLSPSLAKDFKPREDSMQNIPFRLLNHGVDLSTPEVSYITLSYCWAENNAAGGGAERRVQQAINLKDESERNSSEHPLPCSPLLFKGLLNERSFPHEYVDRYHLHKSTRCRGKVEGYYCNEHSVPVCKGNNCPSRRH